MINIVSQTRLWPGQLISHLFVVAGYHLTEGYHSADAVHGLIRIDCLIDRAIHLPQRPSDFIEFSEQANSVA